MSIVQIAAELGNDDRFARSEFGQTRISFAHFKCETFGAITRQRSGRAVSAERDPVAIMFSRKIIFERIPFSFRLIEPVYMPDPGQIIGAFRAHKIDNVAVSRDVTLRSLAGAPIPFTVPTKPFSVRLRSPLDQNRRAECLGV